MPKKTGSPPKKKIKAIKAASEPDSDSDGDMEDLQQQIKALSIQLAARKKGKEVKRIKAPTGISSSEGESAAHIVELSDEEDFRQYL